MKIEEPPPFKLQTHLLNQILSGEFEAFLSKSDERYFYYDDIKYRKDLPFDHLEETWNLIKSYRTTKYEYLQFGKYRFSYYISQFV